MKRPELRAGAATQPQAGGERLCHPQGGLLRLLRRLERLEGRLHSLVNDAYDEGRRHGHDAYDLTRFVASIRQSLTPGFLPGPTVQSEEEKGPK